jgi:hypothetical protein
MIKRLGLPRVAIIVIGFLLCVPLVYVGAGMGVYYWKEHAAHFEAGAIASLEGLSTIERNYRFQKGAYSAEFEELGVPLGAFSHANQLTWNAGYVYEFSNVSRDPSGRVTDFQIIARPIVYKRGSKRNYLMDQAGNVYVTTENRPATLRDQKLHTRREQGGAG